jgi:chromosome segregation ATPase
MKYRIFGACAIAGLGSIAGCNNGVTTSDVSNQQQAVEGLTKDIQKLENEKETRVAEAAKQERLDVEKELQRKREDLVSEQEQLGALKERQAFEDDMQSKLTAVEKRIEQLDQEADRAEGDTEVRLREQIAVLQTRHDQLQLKLDELRAASGDAWSTLKTSVASAWKSAEAGMQTTSQDQASPAAAPSSGLDVPPAGAPAAP